MPPDNQQYAAPQSQPPAGAVPPYPPAPDTPVPDPSQFTDQSAQAAPQMMTADQPAPMQPLPQQSAPEQPQPSADKKGSETKQQSPNTTQHSLLFSELREGMVIMGDGTFRAIVACESINFDLMSSREREGVEYSYQNFLNSLSFDVQIYISSRQVDISPYLEKLSDLRRSQDNMLLGVMMDDYLAFIDDLAQGSNIMDKRFYIIVPFSAALDASKIVDKGKGFFSRFFVQNAKQVTKIDQPTYEKAKEELQNRVQTVISGLYQVGVRCAQLNTKELGELYYGVYNPDTAMNQPLGDFESTTSMYVKRAQPVEQIPGQGQMGVG